VALSARGFSFALGGGGVARRASTTPVPTRTDTPNPTLATLMNASPCARRKMSRGTAASRLL
jgi:hypothetical protein